MQSLYMSAARGIADQQDTLMHSLAASSVPYSIKPEPLPATHLYLCNRRKDVQFGEGGNVKHKPSMEVLQQSYKALNSRKLKETLSSFLPDIPGEFDSVDIPDTTLRGLIDHPPMGGADFIPLNGQALLGFRLVPGSLPEQYRIDPTLPPSEVKHHHKKKKRHKHKAIDKSDNGTTDQAPTSVNTQGAPDAFLFIHPDMSPNPPLHPPAHVSLLPISTMAVPSKVPHPYSAGIPVTGTTITPSVPLEATSGKKRKKKHENGDGQPKKKKKRDKDKKKKKHHSLDMPTVQAPPLTALPPSAHTHATFPHQPI